MVTKKGKDIAGIQEINYKKIYFGKLSSKWKFIRRKIGKNDILNAE